MKLVSDYHKKIENILTIDVEDWFHILELPSEIPVKDWIELENRVVNNTLSLLNLLRRYNAKATFFVLGWVAQYCPDLIREIEKEGHEIATHGYSHQLIHHLTPREFAQDISLSLEYLSRVAKKPIRGYRAPGFSLTEDCSWALDILLELGLSYDASIFPLKRNHGGYENFAEEAGYVTTPKRKQILEIPVTCNEILGKKLYLLGGGYFRISPSWVIESGIKQLNRQGKPAMIYLHPREIDPLQPRLEMSKKRTFMSYVNLHKTESKLEKILQKFKFNSIENIWQLSSVTELMSTSDKNSISPTELKAA